ncbi:uncharacterized protein LOC144127603 isoform X1 [Amblyomma americanum]
MLQAGLGSCRISRRASLTHSARWGHWPAVSTLGPISLPLWMFDLPARNSLTTTAGAHGARKAQTLPSRRWMHVTAAVHRLGHPHPHRVPLAYKERHAVVTTCGHLYEKWRAEERPGYKNAPETGAEVRLVYVHTGMDRAEHKDTSERPLALLLTGSPGQYQDFSYTIPFLDRHGVDVLCFNWPSERKASTFPAPGRHVGEPQLGSLSRCPADGRAHRLRDGQVPGSPDACYGQQCQFNATSAACEPADGLAAEERPRARPSDVLPQLGHGAHQASAEASHARRVLRLPVHGRRRRRSVRAAAEHAPPAGDAYGSDDQRNGQAHLPGEQPAAAAQTGPGSRQDLALRRHGAPGQKR